MISDADLARASLKRVGIATDLTPLSVYSNPADFIENEMYIPETPGVPLKLHPEIRRVLLKMFERRADDTLRYMTMIFSSIKKSGKTTIGGGIALWQAYHVRDGEVYIVGNDQRQADNRMNQAIRYCLAHNPRMADVRVKQNHARLPNGTKIEALAVDSAGEAGANPTGIFWTEVWGAIHRRHEDFFSEMTLSPTRQGHSFKFFEGYAGFIGISKLWERLYNAAVKNHPPLDPDISPELYEDGNTVAYWNTRRYLPWQIGEAAEAYYAQEAKEKTPSEWRRHHMNEWSVSEDTYIPLELWDMCKGEIPPMSTYGGVIVGIDAGIAHDCFGIVVCSRKDGIVAVREARKWTPPPGGRLDFGAPGGPEEFIKELPKRYRHVACFCYDEYQMAYLADKLRREQVGYFKAFSQGQSRLIADQKLHDVIVQRRIVHDGNPDLREHMMHANAKQDGDKLRIVKRQGSAPIDLVVAMSMACHEALYWNIE
jgi:phage terminase large subunit-like protein